MSDAYNPTPVWQMYNLPSPSTGGAAPSDGGQSSGSMPQTQGMDKVGSALKSDLADETSKSLFGNAAGGVGGGLIKSLGSILLGGI